MVSLVPRDFAPDSIQSAIVALWAIGEMMRFHMPKPKDSKAHSANDGHQQDGYSDCNSDPSHSGHHHATTAIPAQSAPKAKACHQSALRMAQRARPENKAITIAVAIQAHMA